MASEKVSDRVRVALSEATIVRGEGTVSVVEHVEKGSASVCLDVGRVVSPRKVVT